MRRSIVITGEEEDCLISALNNYRKALRQAREVATDEKDLDEVEQIDFELDLVKDIAKKLKRSL